MSPASAKVPVEVEGRQLALSNLDKVLYPAAGFVKAQVIDYYTRIAPVILPYLEERALTVIRFPDGVEGGKFFEKNSPRGRPEWVRTERLPSPGSSKDRETIDYTVVEGLPTLVWLANLAALELHVHQWRIGADRPDLLVLDLDPGPPATIVECCEVARRIRPLAEADGLELYAKTSGSKGMQLYARADRFSSSEETSEYAHELAKRLERDDPDLVVSRMTRALRPGKVLVDWSQNNSGKTTVCAYSLRAREHPTVSTPVTWEEVEACERPEDLRFTTDDVLKRVEELGDVMAPVLSQPSSPAPARSRRRR